MLDHEPISFDKTPLLGNFLDCNLFKEDPHTWQDHVDHIKKPYKESIMRRIAMSTFNSIVHETVFGGMNLGVFHPRFTMDNIYELKPHIENMILIGFEVNNLIELNKVNRRILQQLDLMGIIKPELLDTEPVADDFSEKFLAKIISDGVILRTKLDSLKAPSNTTLAELEAKYKNTQGIGNDGPDTSPDILLPPRTRQLEQEALDFFDSLESP